MKEDEDKVIMWRRVTDTIDEDQQQMFMTKSFLDQGLALEDIRESPYLQTKAFVQTVRLVYEKSPILLKQMCVNQQFSSSGVYQFRFYINGELKPIAVDDYVPYIQDQMISSSCALGGKQDYLLPLMEKAWAKVCGSYEKCGHIHVLEILKSITNNPVVLLHHDLVEQDEIWAKI